MRSYRISRHPRSLHRSTVHLVNITLAPASHPPYKEKWSAIANGLPCGDVLIVPPYQAKQQRVARRVASRFREKGPNVLIMSHMLESNAT